MKNQQAMGEVVRTRLASLALSPGDPGTESEENGAEPEGNGALTKPISALRRFGREHLAAVAVVLLVGVASTAWAAFRAHTTPVPAVPSPVVSVTQPEPTAGAAPSQSPSPVPEIQVHVLGAVASPGVVTLPQGARVHEAVAAAGGMRSRARPGDLNLAAVVADGSQVVIGDSSSPGGALNGSDPETASSVAGGTETGGAVDLNNATAEQLQTLPGVGPVTASNIIDWRTENGRFKSVTELTEVSGIGPKTLARLQDRVTVG